MLYKADYEVAIKNWISINKKETKDLLKDVDIIREWSLYKKSVFQEAMQEITYLPGQTIYSLGDPSENVFIVKRGKVQLEIFFTI